MAQLALLSGSRQAWVSRIGAAAYDLSLSRLSIIVTVHNQFVHNTLFLDGVRRYTTGPYDVIDGLSRGKCFWTGAGTDLLSIMRIHRHPGKNS